MTDTSDPAETLQTQFIANVASVDTLLTDPARIGHMQRMFRYAWGWLRPVFEGGMATGWQGTLQNLHAEQVALMMRRFTAVAQRLGMDCPCMNALLIGDHAGEPDRVRTLFEGVLVEIKAIHNAVLIRTETPEAVASHTPEEIASVPPNASIGTGMPHEVAAAQAEEYCQRNGGQWPGRNELARIVGCSQATMTKAIDRSAYLRARRSEADSARKVQGRPEALSAVITASTVQTTELDPPDEVDRIDTAIAVILGAAKPSHKAIINKMNFKERKHLVDLRPDEQQEYLELLTDNPDAGFHFRGDRGSSRTR